ncbi:hypothetical protein LWI29_009531 [Acer saccharum]|uniref:Uncharacterized protein n=1 Tax=Acer saccharum TaxID=4024 RepID=A0AA39T8R6_ACESA|nr:hypothetical protein LWI29_009531 [Acer saccharum]
MMIPFAFFAGTGVRVANELGAGNGKGAKFATAVAVSSCPPSSKQTLSSLSFHYSTQQCSASPLRVAVGSGWQSYVAYINLGCYYVIGVPLGFVMGWVFNQGVMGSGWNDFRWHGSSNLDIDHYYSQCDWDREAKKASMHVRKWGAEAN